MSEAHRYRAIKLLTEDGNCINYHSGGPEVVMATSFDRVTAERDAALAELNMVRKAVPNSTLELVSLQQRLTAADERADVLETENKRLDLMVSQADYNYDADRMQFKSRIDELEELLFALPDGLKDLSGCENTAGVVACIQYVKYLIGELKPAEPAKDEHVCTGCGNKGWTANCKECVPY